MKTFKRIASVFTTMIFAIALFAACSSSSSNSSTISKSTIVNSLNAARSSVGTHALTEDARASETAQALAEVLAERQNGIIDEETSYAKWRSVISAYGKNYIGYNYFYDCIPTKSEFLRWYNNGVNNAYYHKLVSSEETQIVGVGIVKCAATKSGYVIVVTTY